MTFLKSVNFCVAHISDRTLKLNINPGPAKITTKLMLQQQTAGSRGKCHSINLSLDFFSEQGKAQNSSLGKKEKPQRNSEQGNVMDQNLISHLFRNCGYKGIS